MAQIICPLVDEGLYSLYHEAENWNAAHDAPISTREEPFIQVENDYFPNAFPDPPTYIIGRSWFRFDLSGVDRPTITQAKLRLAIEHKQVDYAERMEVFKHNIPAFSPECYFKDEFQYPPDWLATLNIANWPIDTYWEPILSEPGWFHFNECIAIALRSDIVSGSGPVAPLGYPHFAKFYTHDVMPVELVVTAEPAVGQTPQVVASPLDILQEFEDL
jgi:hypothetical protein